jgi:hypothetical protein
VFDSLTIRDTRPILWLKRVFVAFIAVYVGVGLVSAHRAYIQVRSLEFNAPNSLSAGIVVETLLVSSGRTTVDVEVDLIQGAHSERLYVMQLRGNEFGFWDPRARHGSKGVTLTPETLSKFQPGAARLRSVAIGRPQWMRLPPPTVRELEVEIK